MQLPTCTGIHVRSVRDAHIIFHAARTGLLPVVRNRLDNEERRAVRPGNVYVWEERVPNSRATGHGIERWTDGIPWSASRVRDEFLYYHEKDRSTNYNSEGGGEDAISDRNHNGSRLVKQTYSVLVNTETEGQRKWHLTAYFVPDKVSQLKTVDDMPTLAVIRPQEGMYVSAKHTQKGLGKDRARESFVPSGDRRNSTDRSPGTAPVYAPYTPLQTLVPVPIPSVSPLWSMHPATAPDSYIPEQVEVHKRTSPATVPQLPLPPSRSRYPPRHPIDDAALRSLKGFLI